MEPQGAHAFQSGSFRLAAAEIRHAAARPDRGPFDLSRLPPPGGPHLFARHLPLDSLAFEVLGHYQSRCCRCSCLGLFPTCFDFSWAAEGG